MSEAFERIQEIVTNEIRDSDFKVSQDFANCQLSISNSVTVKVVQSDEEDSIKEIVVSWTNKDESLGSHLLSVLQNIGK